MSSYIDHRAVGRPSLKDPGRRIDHSWAAHTRLNLLQRYHPDQVARIMAGNDHQTQIDVGRWNALGRRSAA